jgi:hypothetical protein
MFFPGVTSREGVALFSAIASQKVGLLLDLLVGEGVLLMNFDFFRPNFLFLFALESYRTIFCLSRPLVDTIFALS